MTKNNCRIKEGKKVKTSNPLLKCFNVFVFSLIFIGIGFYLFNISQLATQGFVLKELKFEQDLLVVEKSELEERLSFANSYYSLSSRVASLNMVEISEFEYLKSPSTIARK